jgi:hypothetical protein
MMKRPSTEKQLEYERARRMLKDAQRGAGKYTLDDYVWLVKELAKLLDCEIES